MPQRGRPITLSEDDLLAAAFEVFRERGLDATTADVARKARISEGAIFHRYRTKEALILAVLERQLLALAELGDLAAEVTEGDLAERLLELAMALVERARTLSPLLMLALGSPIKLGELLRRVYPARLRLIDTLARALRAEARRGQLRRVDCQLLARLFWGSVHERVTAELFEGGGCARRRETAYFKGVIAMLLDGVRAGARS